MKQFVHIKNVVQALAGKPHFCGSSMFSLPTIMRSFRLSNEINNFSRDIISGIEARGRFGPYMFSLNVNHFRRLAERSGHGAEKKKVKQEEQ